MYMIAAMLQESLTLGKILEDVPHTPAAIFVYLLLAASAVLILRASRNKAPQKPNGTDGTAH